MTVTFRCGHRQDVAATVVTAPVCAACGERVVARVTGATPRFVGQCRGPYAEYRDLAPVQVALRAQEQVHG